eukprot:602185-Pelagomonas_calceolata.AAC.2
MEALKLEGKAPGEVGSLDRCNRQLTEGKGPVSPPAVLGISSRNCILNHFTSMRTHGLLKQH